MDVRLVIYDDESAAWAGEVFGSIIDDLDSFLRYKLGRNYYVYNSYSMPNEFSSAPRAQCAFNDMESDDILCEKELITPYEDSIQPFEALTLEELLGQKNETFNEKLMEYIIRSEMTNAEIYSRANMSKQSFSKIYSGSVMPKKDSIIALAIALSLTMDETNDLLNRAGHSLIKADKRDTIFSYFISTGKTDIHLINECLFKYNMDMLGNVVA